MYKNLKTSVSKISIEGIIFQEYFFEGEVLCISAYDPHRKKHSLGETFDVPFTELKNFAELEGIISKIDRMLSISEAECEIN